MRLETGPEAETLAELTRLRRSTRRRVADPAAGALAFGAVTVLCALVLAATGDRAFVVAWLLLGIATVAVLFQRARSAGVRAGAIGRERVALSWSVGFFALCFLAALAAGNADVHAAGVLATVLVVLLGYAALGLWQRDPGPLAAGAAAAVPPFAAALLGAAPWLVELTFGLGLLGAGLWFLLRGSHR